MDVRQRDERQGGAGEIAQQEAARSLVFHHHEPDGESDCQQDVREAGRKIGPCSLVEAKQGHQQFVIGEQPQAGDRDQRKLGVAAVEDELRQRARKRDRDQGTRRAREEQEPDRSARDVVPLTAIVVRVVEAQQRLDDPEPDHDADGDDRRQQYLRRTVVGTGEVPRIDGQKRNRDQLCEDARSRIGRTGGRQTLDVFEHQERVTPSPELPRPQPVTCPQRPDGRRAGRSRLRSRGSPT